MMKILLLISLCFTATFALNTNQKEQEIFKEFKLKYGKIYENVAEEEMRFKIFSDNLKVIKEHNLKLEMTWTLGINHLTDRTDAEYNAMMGYKHIHQPNNLKTKKIPNINLDKLPKNVDWSKKGAISPVKNQGNCGSCWAFATTENLESYVFLTNKTLPILSPQQFTSCAPNALKCGGIGGCKGSVPQLGYVYANLEGIVSEKDYPYTSGTTGKTGKCTYNPKNTPPKATVSGFEMLPNNDYASVMNHIATVGPLVISVAASNWRHYHGGVFDGCPFDKDIVINHNVQLVGYGTDSKLGDYWKVRNSWGTTYGEEGYIRLKRYSAHPKCGLDKQPLDGFGCAINGNTTVKVCGTCGILSDSVYPINAYLLQ